MERLDPRARSDIYGRRINRAHSPLRARSVPWVSVMLGSALPVLLIADLMPVLPSLGFLMLLGWRMVRPGLLPLWAGAPLGAFDDLVSGQPFGSAIMLWSLAMIAIELIETRFPWRDFWHDWFTASVLALAYWQATLLFSGASVTTEMVLASVPQAVMAVLLYPIIARAVAGLDRFRLARARKLD
jgi:rod shape-determining protein MreD